uniref:Uncharacterized protein n=1 Tax=Cannabis sativa TaxID=3483 RepID=A0A803Q380_CANSA
MLTIALDKIRFGCLTDKSKLDAQIELFVRLVPYKANNTFSITGSGIRMTKADLVNNLGTIARSGTKRIHGGIAESGLTDVDGEQLGRETKITLFLKEDQLEYLEERRIKDLVKKHSELISYPIYLWTKKTTEKEISDDEDEGTKKEEEGDIEEVVEERKKDSKRRRKLRRLAMSGNSSIRKNQFG